MNLNTTIDVETNSLRDVGSGLPQACASHAGLAERCGSRSFTVSLLGLSGKISTMVPLMVGSDLSPARRRSASISGAFSGVVPGRKERKQRNIFRPFVRGF